MFEKHLCFLQKKQILGFIYVLMLKFYVVGVKINKDPVIHFVKLSTCQVQSCESFKQTEPRKENNWPITGPKKDPIPIPDTFAMRQQTNARDFLSRASTARNAHLDLVSVPMIGHLSPILCSHWLIEAPKPQLWILQILSSMNDSKNNSRFKTTASEWFVHHLMKSFHSNFSPLRTDIKT